MVLRSVVLDGALPCDGKPSNIFLRGQRVDDVALMDFGIARRSRQVRGLTQTGFLVGTPEYMAPEQARGQRDIGPEADVFSIGCVLYECLTGRPPFCADQMAVVIAKILFADTIPVVQLRPSVPLPLSELVSCTLAKDPAQRPRNAQDLLSRIEVIIAQVTLPDHALASPQLFESYPAHEQQLVSVVLAARDPESSETAHDTEERLGILRSLLLPYEAMVELLGDGVVAIVLPSRDDMMATDQVAQAARCALLVRERLPEYRLSLTTGRGRLSERRPLGDALDRAVALLATDTQRGILIDEITGGLLDSRFQLRKQSGTSFFLDSETVSVDVKRPLLGKPTPCVGRERELAILEALYMSCRDEETIALALVLGEAGVGKSRLRHEFVRRLESRQESVQIWLGRGEPLSAGSSYAMLAQALRRACGILDGEPNATQTRKLQQRLSQSVPAADLPRVTEFLAEICGMPTATPGPALRAARQDARLMAEQASRAFIDLLKAECGSGPLLLILEDLHWGDAMTVRLIDSALQALADRPLMVLSLARPDVESLFPRLWAGRFRQDLRLELLGKKACERLIRQVLGAQVDTPTVNRLVDQAGGNPLFLEELIRATADGKGGEPPQTVLAMLQSRFLRMDHGARRLLRIASVFGQTFWHGGLVEIAGREVGHESGSSDLARWLRVLIEQETIEEHEGSRFPEEREYGFRHALLRDAAYGLLDDDQRPVLHRAVAQFLERAGERDPLVLAEHWLLGGEQAQAGKYFLRAGEQAHRCGDTESVHALARRGLDCNPDDATHVGLLALICQAHLWRNQWGPAASYADKVHALAPRGSAPWGLAATAIIVNSRLQKRERFLAVMDEVARAEPREDAIATHAFALAIGIFVLDLGGESALAERYLQQLHFMVAPVQEVDPLARAWMQRAHIHREAWMNQNPWLGREYSYLTQASFQATDHRRGAAVGQAFIGINSYYLGDLELAEKELRATLPFEDDLGLVSSLRTQIFVLVLIDLGRIDEAAEHAHAFLRFYTERPAAVPKGRAHAALAELHLCRGELDDAKREIDTAVPYLEESPLDLCAAQLSRAAIALLQGNAAVAATIAADALQSANAHGWLVFCGARAFRILAQAQLQLDQHAACRDTVQGGLQFIDRVAAHIPDEPARRHFTDAPPQHRALSQLLQDGARSEAS